MTDFNEPQEQNVGERSSGLLSANEPAWSWFPLAIQSSEFRNSMGVWLFKYDIYAAPSQGLHAIGPGIAPQGDVSTHSSAGEADISQQHSLPSFDAFFAHWADPSRNSAETTDTSLDCRYSPDLLLHIDLLASSLWFWSPFPSSSAPRRVSALAEGASRGLSILHPGLSVQRPWPVIQLHTHTHAYTYTQAALII